MMTRKNLSILVLLVLLMSLLTACMGESMTRPAREVPITVEAATEAKNVLMAVRSGEVTLSESQFSSYLTILLQQNMGQDGAIESITAMFDPDRLHLNATLNQAILGIDHLSLSGNIIIQDHQVMIDLDGAAAGPFRVSEAVADLISRRINAALDHPALGAVVNISMAEGSLTLSLAGMEASMNEHMDQDKEEAHDEAMADEEDGEKAHDEVMSDEEDGKDAHDEAMSDEEAGEDDSEDMAEDAESAGSEEASSEETDAPEASLPFGSTFSGLMTGDNNSQAALTASLTQDGNNVSGVAEIGPGLLVDVGTGFCPGVQEVPPSTINLSDTLNPDRPNHLESTSQMNISGYNVSLEVQADLSADQSTLDIQVLIKVPFPCTSPELSATLSRN